MKKSSIINIIVFAFIILFIYAATSKILDFQTFKAQIGKSPLIMNYADILAWIVPLSEYLIVIFLLIPRLTLIGLYGSFTIMLSFTAYIASILSFSPYVPCSCGGILNSLGWKEHLIFNIIFTIAGIIGINLYLKDQRSKQISLSNITQ